MRLRRLDLTRYGKFTDYAIDFGEHVPGTPDLHIVYGLNEAGKSTSLSAYLDLLFGIEERTRYGFLHQGKAMEVGGCLEFGGAAHELKRVKQRRNSLLNGQGEPVSEALLGAPLAGLTREAYRMMFSLDDQTLEDGGNAILESKGDLGELLFSASAGLAGTSAVLEAAAEEADGIFRKRASSTAIAALKRRIADLKARRDEIDTQASAYAALSAALRQAEAAYDDTMQEIGAAKARQDEIARILRAHPLAADHRRGQEALREYRTLPRPPAAWTSAVAALIDDETRLQTRLAGIEQREARLREELAGLTLDERVLAIADRVASLQEAAARYTTAGEDLPKRKSALAERNRQVDLILAGLGQRDIADAAALLVPAATIGALRDLIADKSGIDVARQSAEKEHAAARMALEEAQLARQALDSGGAIDAGTIARIQSLAGRLRQSDLTAEIRLAERGLPERRRLCADAAAPLHPLDGDALRRLSPPEPGRIEAWKSALASLDKRRSEHGERRRELVSRQQDEDARIAAIRDAAGIVGDEAAVAALAERDAAWERHLAALDRETAHRFEDRMRKADSVAAARIAAARELADLRALTAASVVTKAAIGRQDELLRQIDDELAGLRREIRAETPAEIGLDADAPVASWLATIDRWTKSRASALSAWDDLLRAESGLAAARDALGAEQRALAQVLTQVLTQALSAVPPETSPGIAADVAALPLPALLQAADNLLADRAALQARQAEADRRLQERARDLAGRRKLLDEAAAASEGWRRGWASAVKATWFADRQDSVGAVRELLDALSDLPAALRGQAEIRHRIEAMEADQRDFAAAVSGLHRDLGAAFDGADPLDAAKALIRRYEDARQVLATRRDKEKGLADLALEREELSGDISIHAARKSEMTGFFGVETLVDVRLALERCATRDRLAEQQDRLERQIVGEMQEHALAEALARLAGVDLAGLQREQAERATRLEDLDERARRLFAEKAGAGDRLNAVGGDDAAARVEADRRTVLLEIEDLALRYLRLKSGGLVAEHALRAYRDKHRSAMMNRASEAFRLMTRDEYSGLATRPEKDRETLIGLSRQGGSKLAVDMSKGTRFQLYLALRLAGYEEFATARPSVPFIADDIMETFDELRSEEVFRLFAQMARIGQVIYLTHHRHLCEIARRQVPTISIHEIG